MSAQISTRLSQSIVDRITKYNTDLPSERVYLHFDKPYYSVGDTIWFKGYLVNSALSYSPLSSRLYVDLISDSNQVVKHFIFPISFGLSVGNIYVGPDLVRDGAYTIRAYTNWMRNFSADQFYYANFYVAAPGADPLLVDANTSLSLNHVKVDMKFTGLKGQFVGLRTLQLKLFDDKKILLHDNMQTTDDGRLGLNFDLPGNTPVKNLALHVLDKKDNTAKLIPIRVNRPSDVDIQFMPESGQLVESLPNHIGFKAIGEDGQGIAVKGVIIDKENNEEVSFESIHNGMGVFDFTPLPGETYSVKITLSTGQVKTVTLPEIKKSGTVLKLKGNRPDSVQVSVLATKDIQNGGEYTLIGQAGGVIYFAASFKLNHDLVNIYAPKSLFPTGVVHFTLFNAQSLPVNERVVFINQHDNLKLDVSTPSTSYAPMDSILLHITVKDDEGNPVTGSFSLAVTDDGQVKKQEIANTNIFSQLLLSADLKGYIENPAWYFTTDKDATRALDVLLLTQGWTGYKWNEIFNKPVQPEFASEPEFMIKGGVTNLLNKPIIGSKITLVSTGKVKLYKDTVTNSEGKFTFKGFPTLTDITNFVLEARNAKGRIVNAGISVDEHNQSIPELVSPRFPMTVPWYVNNDSTLLNYVRQSSSYHAEQDGAQYGAGTHLLKMVSITSKVVIKNSHNLNGTGNNDQAISQEEIEKKGKISLFELIKQKINGFHEGNLVGHPPGGTVFVKFFMIKDKKVKFIVDGVNIDDFFEGGANPDDYYNYQKGILDYFSSEDISGIEVMYNMKYNARYNSQYLKGIPPPWPKTPAYVEITTRAGRGPFAKTANGIYVFKPAPVTLPDYFYTPKYPVKNIHRDLSDLRSTVHWEPNIITDRKGEANTHFYAADLSTTYTIILQGADLKGKVGFTMQKLTIKKQ